MPFDPVAAFVLDVADAFFVPCNETAVLDDEGGAGAGDFFVGGVGVESPCGVDLAVDAADGAFVVEAHAAGDLFVAETLGEHFGDGLFVGFEEGHGGVFVFVADFLDAGFDVGVDEALAGNGRC